MSKPFKGMFKDCNFVDQPQNTYREARNILYGKLKDSICNEGGKKVISNLQDEVLGSVSDGIIEVIFLTGNNGSGIRELTQEGFTNDFILLDSTNYLNFNANHPIKAILVRNNKNERIVVWTDDLNPPRILNIDNPIVGTFLQSSELRLLNLFPKSDIPTIDNLTVNSTGGSLVTGSYQIAVSYILDDNSETNYFGLSNFVRITKKSESLIYNKFTGEESGTSTSKSISLEFSNINTSYDKLRLAVVKYIKGVYSAHLIGDYEINGSSLNITYTGSESSTDLLLEEIIIDNASYDTAKTINYSNRNLYLANLTKEPFPDYREYANDITAQWVYEEEVSLDSVKNSYKDPNITYLNASFMPNEVYAFYIAFKLKNGGYSPAFHIPGRISLGTDKTKCSTLADLNPYLSDDVSIDNNIKYFHTRDTSTAEGLMGYWENRNEYYDSEYPDLNGTNVKHHKFPSLNTLTNYTSDFINTSSSNTDFFEGEWEYVALNINNFVTNTAFSTTDFITSELDFENNGIYWTIFSIHFQEDTYINLNQTVEFLSPYQNGRLYYSVVLQDGGKTKHTFFEGTEEPVGTYYNSLNVEINEYNYFVNKWYTLYFKLGREQRADISSNVLNATSIKTSSSLISEGTLSTKKLGVKFSNINTSLVSDIVDGYEIFYAKRGLENSTVTAQSIIFKEGDGSNHNGISDISTNENAAFHPIDLLVNQTYPSINPSYLLNELIVSDIESNKTFDKYQEYSYLISDANKLRPIEETEYIPYSNVNNKETYLKSKLLAELNLNNNTYLTSICQYLPNVYVSYNNQQLVSTGKVFDNNMESTPNIYGGDVYINEVGIRTLPEYSSDINNQVRARYGTYSYICFNRINAGLLQDDPTKVNLFYPFNDIANNPAIGSTAEATYEVWDGLISGMESPDDFDNYMVSNTDLFQLNITNPIGHYNSNNTLDEFPNLIIKSSTNQNDGNAKGLRTFLAANYYEMPKDKGEIMNLESNGSTLLIHHKDGIYKTVSEITLPTNEVDVTLGSGNIFRIEPQEIIPTKTGYAGTQHPSSCLLTKGGYFFIDYKRSKIFLMSDKLEEISNTGMQRWFEDNLPFKLNKQISTPLTTNFSKYGIGFNVVYDDKYNRILLTKRDFTLIKPVDYFVKNNQVKSLIPPDYETLHAEHEYCENESWTISFSLENKMWTSFYSYFPYYRFNILNELYSISDDTIYNDNKEDEALGKASYVDFVFNQPYGVNKLLSSIQWSNEYYNESEILDKTTTFDKALILNSSQYSGDITLSNSNTKYRRGVWNFNGFRDLAGELTTDTIAYENTSYTIYTDKEWYEKKRFIDKYNVVRLSTTNDAIGTLYLTNIDVTQRISTL